MTDVDLDQVTNAACAMDARMLSASSGPRPNPKLGACGEAMLERWGERNGPHGDSVRAAHWRMPQHRALRAYGPNITAACAAWGRLGQQVNSEADVVTATVLISARLHRCGCRPYVDCWPCASRFGLACRTRTLAMSRCRSIARQCPLRLQRVR